MKDSIYSTPTQSVLFKRWIIFNWRNGLYSLQYWNSLRLAPPPTKVLKVSQTFKILIFCCELPEKCWVAVWVHSKLDGLGWHGWSPVTKILLMVLRLLQNVGTISRLLKIKRDSLSFTAGALVWVFSFLWEDLMYSFGRVKPAHWLGSAIIILIHSMQSLTGALYLAVHPFRPSYINIVYTFYGFKDNQRNAIN